MHLNNSCHVDADEDKEGPGHGLGKENKGALGLRHRRKAGY